MKAYIASLLVKKCELYRVSCMQTTLKLILHHYWLTNVSYTELHACKQH